jgi:hypothetical protein
MKAYAINHPEVLTISALAPAIENEDGTDYEVDGDPLDADTLVATWSVDNASVAVLDMAEDGRTGTISAGQAGAAIVTCIISGYPDGTTETTQFVLAVGNSGPAAPALTAVVA